jgi:PAS domain S-box-containing protein
MEEHVVESSARIVLDLNDKIRVLHVDDDSGLLKVAKQCLEMEAPLQVDSAISVEEAMMKLEKGKYDVLVSDYQMPEKDGLDFLKELRSKGNAIPFIIFTGKGREEVAIKALNLGANQYLNKTGDVETVYPELAHGITELAKTRRAEDKLRASEMSRLDREKKLEAIFASSADAITVFDLNGNVVELNEAAMRLHGFTRKEEILGKSSIDFVAPRDRSRAMQLLGNAMIESVRKAEFSLLTVDGREFPVELYANVVKEASGTPIGIVVVTRDVSERKKAEETLERSNARTRAILACSPDAIMVIDMNTIIVDCNEAALRLGGYSSKEEVVGRNALEFISEKDRGTALENLKKIAELGTMRNVEYTALKKNGGSYLAETSGSILRDSSGNPAGFVSVIRDVTERRQMEEELRQSEQKLRSLVYGSPIPAFFIGKDHKVVYWNFALEKYSGLKSEDVIGTDKHWTAFYKQKRPCMADLVLDEDFAQISEWYSGKCKKSELVEGGIEATDFFATIGKDGAWLYFTAVAIRDSKGSVIGALEMLEDITERKKAEEILKRSNEELKLFMTASRASIDGFVMSDLEGRILKLNDAAVKMYGVNEASDLISKSAIDLVIPEDKEKLRQGIKEAMAKGYSGSKEVTIIIDKGARIPVEITTTLVKDTAEHPVGFLSIVRDITERKKAELILFDRQKMLENVLSASPEAIVVTDLKGNVIENNEQARKMFGYSSKDGASGRSGFEFIAEKDRERAIEDAQKTLKQGLLRNNEYAIITKDGCEGIARVSANVVKDAVGNPTNFVVVVEDVTERKKAEAALKETKARLELQIRRMPVGCIVWDKEFRAVSWNPAAETIFGYPARDALGKHPYDIIVPKEAQPVVDKILQRLLEGDETAHSVNDNFTRDGKTITCSWTNTPLKREDNSIIGVLSMVQDVTELKNVEKIVQESRQKFEGLFRHNPEAAVYLDLNFKIAEVNPRFCQLFGWSAEEVKGKNLNDVVVPEGLREEAESLDKEARNGYVSHDTVRKRKDGSLVYLSISAAPVTFENKLLGNVGIYKDITDLKRAQEESEEARKHFQMLFDLMADPVAVVDGRGTILEVTRKVEEITGFKREELVGKNVMKVGMFGAKTKAAMIKSLAKRMMGMHPQPYEVEVLKKDGGKLLYEINAAKIDFKGEPADLVVFRDVSERKNLEEKLRVVGSLTRHDVGNKLSVVTGNAYLLKRKLAGNPEALEQLAEMEDAVKGAEAIFEFARTYEKLGVEQLAYVDMKKTIDETLKLFPDLKGVKIVNECGGLTVLADSLLRQLFYNLIDDSLKYGKKLTQIRIHYEKSENQLKLAYEDDGIGISKDVKAKLFTEGFTTGKGSGYGLYLIGRMMDVYGWTINEKGEPGKGTLFTITIPETNQNGKENYHIV